MLAHAPESRTLLASLVCAVAIACGGGDEGGNDGPGPNGQQDAGQGGMMGGSSDAGGSVSGGQPGMGGMTGGMQGGQAGGDGGTAPVVDAGPPDLGENSKGDTFFRVDTLVLKAPFMYVKVPLLGPQNVTADGQAELDKALTMDVDGDGFVDLSSLIRFFKTTDPKTGSGTTTAGGGMCQMPVGPDKVCGPDKTFPFQPAVGYSNSQQPCTLVGTQDMAAAPCFITEVSSLTMELPILGAVPLQEGQIVGTWEGANISNGLVRGFLSKTTAEATKLGEGVPSILGLVGVKMGTPLVEFFSPNEMGKNSKGEDGWWILMSYTAKPAVFDAALKVP